MHRLFAIVLLSCLHLQPAVNLSVWLTYLANSTYIKEVLCINREKPKLNCNGKCYLMQQLQENQPQQEQELPQWIHGKYEFVFFNACERLQNDRDPNAKKPVFSHYGHDYYLLTTWDIFHPPKA
ncbi:hypothetical protein FGF1_29440 [Flavobacteriaceae bacterium GF1]